MSLKKRLVFFITLLLVVVVAVLATVSFVGMRKEIVDGVQKEIQAAMRGNREALMGSATFFL
ncbi:MAG TPA: hypothetical protein PKN13_03320 [Accumulibacter sp.]|nr:hypothetical protein [Accumulibacter sp.]HMW17269.1 hypothetical protein [Accumulibacter sp.]HMX21595.1 hypothetical protein [Accumulibacter sp.]HMY05577.1 hypothetical protein [Accumulibacter sp.]HNC17837.1 hypothetical protein [Accumulibacter sp.]